MIASNAASMTPATSHPLLNDSSSMIQPEDSDDDDERHDAGGSAHQKPLVDSMITEDQEGGDSEPQHQPASAKQQPLELSCSSSSETTLNPIVHVSTSKCRSGRTSKKRPLVEVSSSSWQDLCTRGSLFKNLLDCAVGKVASAAADAASSPLDIKALEAANEYDNEIKDNNDNSRDNDNRSGKSLVEKLLREKTTECLLSKQKLEQQQSQIVALHAMVDDLRETKKHFVAQTSSLTGAYKQARRNAKRAR